MIELHPPEALDAHEKTPLPAAPPLSTMPDVPLTPHMAGHGRAFATGRPPRNPVDKASWFRVLCAFPGRLSQVV